MKWKLIAGSGVLGNQNFGFFELPKDIQEKQLEELKKHLGETVLISGGGGSDVNLGRLVKAWMREWVYYGIGENPHKLGLAVRLEHIEPKIGFGDAFEPWIGSWQISVKEE